MLALHDVARFGHAPEVADRLCGLAGAVEGQLVAVLAAHARALTDDDGSALDEASRELRGDDARSVRG